MSLKRENCIPIYCQKQKVCVSFPTLYSEDVLKAEQQQRNILLCTMQSSIPGRYV